MSLDLSTLFSFKYIFNLNPGALQPGIYNILIYLFITMIVANFILKIISKKTPHIINKILLKKISSLLVWMTILALLWIFFRQQSVIFLSAPFWLIIWILGFIYWTSRIFHWYSTSGKQKSSETKRFKEKQKYLK